MIVASFGSFCTSSNRILIRMNRIGSFSVGDSLQYSELISQQSKIRIVICYWQCVDWLVWISLNYHCYEVHTMNYWLRFLKIGQDSRTSPLQSLQVPRLLKCDVFAKCISIGRNRGPYTDIQMCRESTMQILHYRSLPQINHRQFHHSPARQSNCTHLVHCTLLSALFLQFPETFGRLLSQDSNVKILIRITYK